MQSQLHHSKSFPSRLQTISFLIDFFLFTLFVKSLLSKESLEPRDLNNRCCCWTKWFNNNITSMSKGQTHVLRLDLEKFAVAFNYSYDFSVKGSLTKNFLQVI